MLSDIPGLDAFAQKNQCFMWDPWDFNKGKKPSSVVSEMELLLAYREDFITSVHATMLISKFIAQLNLCTHEKHRKLFQSIRGDFLSDDGHNRR